MFRILSATLRRSEEADGLPGRRFENEVYFVTPHTKELAEPLLLQQLLDAIDSSLPALLLFVPESFDNVEHGFRGALRLQVLRQNGDVVLEPL
jgi:hypothetical protein